MGNVHNEIWEPTPERVNEQIDVGAAMLIVGYLLGCATGALVTYLVL